VAAIDHTPIASFLIIGENPDFQIAGVSVDLASFVDCGLVDFEMNDWQAEAVVLASLELASPEYCGHAPEPDLAGLPGLTPVEVLKYTAYSCWCYDHSLPLLALRANFRANGP
jgi:hypothetical protein